MKSKAVIAWMYLKIATCTIKRHKLLRIKQRIKIKQTIINNQNDKYFRKLEKIKCFNVFYSDNNLAMCFFCRNPIEILKSDYFMNPWKYLSDFTAVESNIFTMPHGNGMRKKFSMRSGAKCAASHQENKAERRKEISSSYEST